MAVTLGPDEARPRPEKRTKYPLAVPPLLRFHIGGRGCRVLLQQSWDLPGMMQDPVGTVVPTPFLFPGRILAGILVRTTCVSPEHSPGIPLALCGLERSPGVSAGRMVPGVAGHGDLATFCPALPLAAEPLPLLQFSLLAGAEWQELQGLKCCECSTLCSFYLLG